MASCSTRSKPETVLGGWLEICVKYALLLRAKSNVFRLPSSSIIHSPTKKEKKKRNKKKQQKNLSSVTEEASLELICKHSHFSVKLLKKKLVNVILPWHLELLSYNEWMLKILASGKSKKTANIWESEMCYSVSPPSVKPVIHKLLVCFLLLPHHPQTLFGTAYSLQIFRAVFFFSVFKVWSHG